jgi:hypothetical protein
MAKKNKPSKKHSLKYAQPTTGVGTGVTPAPAAPKATTTTPARPAAGAAAVASGRDFSFVAADLRRIAIFAVGLVGIELVLWYLLNHTGLGQAVYNLVSV